ncbi:prefoldin subunit [Candidatus Woesearchaeota archaeon]|nr:prefoldin subunit [Candidatus Woesearchaeota archaeon]
MVEKQSNVNAQENIARLQMLEQNVQAIGMQKQQMQSQLLEIESALKELKTAQTAFKIVGNIMVSSDKVELENGLNQKKELIDVRVKNLEKQEKQFKDKTKQVQEEVLKSLKKE